MLHEMCHELFVILETCVLAPFHLPLSPTPPMPPPPPTAGNSDRRLCAGKSVNGSG